ncbi:MAG: NADH-quinone oxidoreductase subunit A [Dehalococcoidia bacterium]|nr:NADH-quinone oxidoreductase subunit A [Dehalococcoidia bacterium]
MQCDILFDDQSRREYERLLATFGYIAILLIAALSLPILILLIARIVSVKPRTEDPVKTSTYECGMQTLGSSWIQFSLRYYLYALVFVIFDVAVVFLFPWAVQLRELGVHGLLVMAVFVLILVVGLAYAWRRKGLEWI